LGTKICRICEDHTGAVCSSFGVVGPLSMTHYPHMESPALQEAATLDRASRHVEAIAVLSRAAASGDLIAKRTVGLRILLGDRAPSLGPEGVRLICEAANDGDAKSADLAAVLTGAGIHCPQNWSAALDWLQHAAELGSVQARGALCALSDDRDLAANVPEERWFQLRTNIDLPALITPSNLVTLNAEPPVCSVPSFATPPLCEWMMAQAQGRLTRAQVYNPHTGGLEHAEERTNSSALVSLLDTDLAHIVVQARIAATVGRPFGHLEPAFVLHYAPGQTFHDHYDFVDPETPGYTQEIARNGQRILTFLLYLNDDYEGGETDFPRLGLSHRGTLGEGLFFSNVTASGEAATEMLHAGRPPQSGEKWVLSQFIRNRTLVPGHA
jgi:prolyl 4-hydroxylase